jgi:hypothetical protein
MDRPKFFGCWSQKMLLAVVVAHCLSSPGQVPIAADSSISEGPAMDVSPTASNLTERKSSVPQQRSNVLQQT